MQELKNELKRVSSRIRLVRLWRGGAVGLAAGGLTVIGLSLADRGKLLALDWPLAVGVLGGGLALGAATGWFWKLSEKAVARSMDERGGLKDRTLSALSLAGTEGAFVDELSDDALQSAKSLDTRRSYPMRVGPWQYAAFSSTLLAVAAYYVMAVGAFDSAEAKADREEVAKEGTRVEKVTRELFEEGIDSAMVGGEEKDLAEAMRRLAQDMKRESLTKEEAMQRADELAREAKSLSDERFKQLDSKMQSMRSQMAEAKMREADLRPEDMKGLELDPKQMAVMQQMMQQSGADRMQSDKLDQQAMNDMGMSPEAQAMAELSQEQREALAQELQREQQAIQQQLNDPNMSESERKQAAERGEQLKELQKQLELSEKAQKMLKELQESEEFKQLQKVMQELQEKAECIQSGECPTPQELDQLQAEMDKLAEMMDDPAMREAMKQQMQQMMEDLKNGQLSEEAAQTLSAMLGMNGNPGRGQDANYQGEGENAKSDTEMALEGKTNTTAVKGQRQDKGSEEFVEIKAPTMVGSKTSVPYDQVLPKYQKSAESALGAKKIPKKHEQKVKEYFDSLGGSKKK